MLHFATVSHYVKSLIPGEMTTVIKIISRHITSHTTILIVSENEPDRQPPIVMIINSLKSLLGIDNSCDGGKAQTRNFGGKSRDDDSTRGLTGISI